MKKIIYFFITLAVLCSLCSLSSAEAVLPAAGDVVNGFEVIQTRPFDLLGADIILYEHQKTGAKIMYIANDDLNRAFDITFDTPTLDSKGISHVFEHSTLDGSKKYPSKTLFMNLVYQTYNTYMNASTYSFMTTFPLASMSEEQLLKLADYYTDSCFNPLIYTDESIFREEAWRYSMNSPQDELTIAGTVYSEMQGAYNIDFASLFHFFQDIFPGAAYSNVLGGKPDAILTMTWEDLKEYHTAYYHPSNSISFLYGKFDHPDAFLALLDSYFSAYDPKEFPDHDAAYTPITEPVSNSYEYGVSAGTDTSNGSTVYYGFVCGNATQEEAYQADMLTTLLGADFSPIVQRMKEELPSARVSCTANFTLPELCIYFNADGVNAEDAETFKTIVDESIAQIIEEGFRRENTEAIVSNYKLSILLATESSSVGVNTIRTIAKFGITTGNPLGYMEYIDTLDSFSHYVEDGTMISLMQKYLVNNPRTALTLTVPVAGLKDVQDAELAEKLAQIKADMTDEEIAQIVADTNLGEPAEDNSQYVRQLTAVTVDTLPEETRIFDISDDTDESGLRRIHIETNTDGVGKTAVMLDAQGLTQDQIHYFKLYTDSMGELSTSKHTRQELSTLITRYLYDGVIRVSAVSENDACHPYLRATFTALDEDMQAGYDLIAELLFQTDFTDVPSLKNQIASLKNSVKSTINKKAYSILYYRADSTASPTRAYFNYASYLDYYDFLCKTEKLLESEPDSVVAQLQAVQLYFNNSRNAISGFVGSAKSSETHRASADSFFASLDNREIVPQTYTFPSMANPEAIIIDDAVQFNMVYAPIEALGLEEYSGDLDAVTSLVTDAFLLPLLRDQYGVYSILHAASEDGVYIISYRDSNIQETFDVFAQLGDLVASLDNLDQETLNGYILSCYSSRALTNGELTEGFDALLEHISGTLQEEKVLRMHELKSLTPESFKAYSSLYRLLGKKGLYGTAGSVAAINANADLYEKILNPFGTANQADDTAPKEGE